ncbi:MAG: hypothetical protein ABSB15_03290 [Bryobacteraceae bacterium]|jgi:hypothetical protein
MRARRLMFVVWVCGRLLDASPPQTAEDPEKATASLRQITNELNETVKRFQIHLDHEIAVHGRGYQTKSGKRIPGADADLIGGGGAADVVQAAMRKLFAARMIAARRPGYAPAPLADFDRIEALIAEARSRINTGNDAMRRLLVVSAREINPGADAKQRMRTHELLKARNAAADAAKRALVALPVALPEADSAAAQRETVWDLMVANRPIRNGGEGKVDNAPPLDAAVVPIRFETGTRITLVNEYSCRVTLTDSGMEDRQGRHLFYQEEWVRRAGNMARTATTGTTGVVVLMRWAVAVDTVTGQHTLLRRYEAREFFGDFDDLYKQQRNGYVVNASLPERASPPSLQELTSALGAVDRSRQDIDAAVHEFRQRIRAALERNDELLDGQNKPALDDELPGALRENLFAIRGHLAENAAALEAESKVHLAVDRAAAHVRALEALEASADGSALRQEAPPDSRALLDALNRADAAINLTHSLEKEALAALPQDFSAPEQQFPAMMKDVIVRLRRIESAAGPSGPRRFKQEVWRIAGSVRGAREAKRTIVFIDVAPATGSQIPTAKEVKYYKADPGEQLEEIYDENAAQ